MDERTILRAGALELDVRNERALLNGLSVPMARKPWQVLQTLMESPQRLVTKDDLIAKVWGGRAVSDGVLTTAIKDLRQALNDMAREPHFIETVHGRGYRFLPRVERVNVGEAAADEAGGVREDRGGAMRLAVLATLVRPRRAAVAGSVLLVLAVSWFAIPSIVEHESATPSAPAAAPPHPKSVVVLAFSDHSRNHDLKWFADGLTDELVNSLARMSDLRVVDSAGLIRAKGKDLRAQARTLGVAHVLTGSVRRAGERMRIAVRLVRASDGQTLWSNGYNTASTNIIQIQEDIAFSIGRALRTVLDPDALARMVAAGTRSVEAYEAYLLGRAYHQSVFETGDMHFRRLAYEQFEKARALDSNFSDAHYQAALFWYERKILVTAHDPADAEPGRTRALFEERARDAVTTSADRPVTLKYRAFLNIAQMDYIAARRDLQDYLKQRPNDVFAWAMLIRASVRAADYETGRFAAERFAAIAGPQSQHYSRTIPSFLWARDPAGALRYARNALKRAPDNLLIVYQAHRAFLWAREREAAAALLHRIEASKLGTVPKIIARLRQACAEGNIRLAQSLGDEIKASSEATTAERWMAEVLLSHHDEAAQVLMPFDRPDTLHELSQFLTYPFFDVRPFPVLSRALAARGIERPLPDYPPYICPIGTPLREKTGAARPRPE